MTVNQITAPLCPAEGERRACFSAQLFSSHESEKHKDRNDLANRKNFKTFHHTLHISALFVRLNYWGMQTPQTFHRHPGAGGK